MHYKHDSMRDSIFFKFADHESEINLEINKIISQLLNRKYSNDSKLGL